MKMLAIPIIAIFCQVLTGCSHTQWTAVETKTRLASFVNPLGFAINMVASVGELTTRPSGASRQTEDKPTEQ